MCKLVFLIILSCIVFKSYGNPKKSICPEEKKRHPGDCRLFYRCVSVKSAQTSVWLPTRCSAGKVFHPILKRCLPDLLLSNCDRTFRNEILERIPEEKDLTSKPLALSYKKSSVYLPELSENDIDKGPIFGNTVNTSPDRIKIQMDQIYQLINSYKRVRPYDTNSPSKIDRVPIVGLPFFSQKDVEIPTEGKPLQTETSHPLKQQIDIQSTSTLTNLNEHHQTNLNLLANKLNEFPFNASLDANEEPKDYPSPEYLISKLFEKYLTNKDFLDAQNPSAKNSLMPITSLKKTLVTKSSQTVKRRGKFCEKNAALESNDDCLHFYFCNSKDIPFNFDCLNVNAYDDKTKLCNFKAYRNCTKTQSEDITYGLPFSCEITKRLPDPTSRHHYFICVLQEKSWKSTRLRCRNGKTFQKGAGSCGL